MTFTVAFLILALGIAIGYRLPGPVARLKAYYRRRTYRPAVLKRFDETRLQGAIPAAAELSRKRNDD